MLTAAVLLSGCKDDKRSSARSAAAAAQRVRQAAEQAILSGTAAAAQMQFRGVQVYSQAMPHRTAVCGQVNPFLDDPDIFVPFVSVVTAPEGQDDRTPHYQFEQHVATTTSEASRVYLAIVTYCYDNGGPTPGPYHSVMSMPPFPDKIPGPPSGRPSLSHGASAAAPGPAAGRAPAAASLFMRQNGNLHARPHGPAVRVVPQGTAMRVFSEAPGGWLEVGGTEPWGWVHESLLERR